MTNTHMTSIHVNTHTTTPPTHTLAYLFVFDITSRTGSFSSNTAWLTTPRKRDWAATPPKGKRGDQQYLGKRTQHQQHTDTCDGLSPIWKADEPMPLQMILVQIPAFLTLSAQRKFVLDLMRALFKVVHTLWHAVISRCLPALHQARVTASISEQIFG